MPQTRRGAAGRGHVLDHPVATDRRLAVRADLRGRAEEHRPVGPVRRDRARGSARQGARRIRPSVWDYQAMADEGSMLNTPPTFALVHRRAGAQVAAGAGRARGDGRRATAPRPSCSIDAIDESGFYRNPVAQCLPLVDERAVHAGATRSSSRPSSPRRRPPGSSTSRATARSAACAPASTTPCRSRACRRSSPSCRNSSAATADELASAP